MITMAQLNELIHGGILRNSDGARISESLRGNPVLTVAAMIVTTEHAKAQSLRSRQGMEEWFLLNGVALQCRNISKGDIKSTPFIEADFADAWQAFQNDAAVSASKTAKAVVG